MADFDLDALVTEFGDKFVNRGQTMADVHAQLFETGGLEEHFTEVNEDSDVYEGAYASVGEVLQAFSIPFTDQGAITFKPVSQKMGIFKMDTLITPDQLRGKWSGFLSEHAKNADRSTWGVLQWALQMLLIPKAQETFKLQVAYWGWQFDGSYDPAPVVNGTTFQRQLKSISTPNPANASMDGIHTQIARWKAAGRTRQITTGAFTTGTPATFCTEIEEFVWDSSLNDIRFKMDKLFMSQTLQRIYREGRRAKYNMNYAQESDLDMILDTNIKVVGTTDQEGSSNIWMTPPGNRVKPTRGSGNKLIDVQKKDRQVKFLSDWSYVLTFDVPEFIVHNDLDTTITAPLITARYTEA